MVGKKIVVEKDETVAPVLKSDPNCKSAELGVVACENNGVTADSTHKKTTSGLPTDSMKGEAEKTAVAELGAYNPPTGCYSYYYPGYNGHFNPMDNGYYHTDGSHKGVQSEDGSVYYYLPTGYNPYGSGTLVGVDGQCVGQQPYYSSAGYLQPPVSYGSDPARCYSWDSAYVGDTFNGTSGGFANGKYGGSAQGKLNGFNTDKTNGSTDSKFSKTSYSQANKPLSKAPPLSSNFGDVWKPFHPAGKLSSLYNQRQGLYHRSGQTNYNSNGRLWNGNDRFTRDKFSRNGDMQASTELTRGPRSQNKSAAVDALVGKEDTGSKTLKDRYNLPDFQTEYEKAKFYIIKSYNEDDIHKSIKYSVWASTPSGNKKLDAAFQAESETDDAATKRPIFLLFSVNGSGQFVGLAEMVGKVDFEKDMNFWQIDKWNGFFPVQWHIVKDIPNNHLRHIILENNENKPVTHSRDTQEVGLKQGLEMLQIFKNYSAKTSLLDDFTFYENREKSLIEKKNKATLQMEFPKAEDDVDDFPKYQMKGRGRKSDEDTFRVKNGDNSKSLIALTKNLSLNSHSQKDDAVKKVIENTKPAVAAP